MLMIRLQRVGRKNDPHFRVIVTDKRNAAKAGKAIEILGSYSPRQKTSDISEERTKYWISVGAKLSGTVHNLLVSKNIIEGEKIDVSAKSKKKEKEETFESQEKSGTETPAESKTESQVGEESSAKTETPEPAVEAPEPGQKPETDKAKPDTKLTEKLETKKPE